MFLDIDHFSFLLLFVNTDLQVWVLNVCKILQSFLTLCFPVLAFFLIAFCQGP